MDSMYSCVIPVIGARPYFKDAFASIEKQGVDIEVIVQDGGAGSGASKEFGVEGLRNVEWFSEADCGQSDALNKGFAKAHGDWLFWLNADDVLLPGAIKKVSDFIANYTKLQTLNSKLPPLVWITGNQLLIDANNKVLKCSVGNGWHSWLYCNAVPHVYGPSAFFRRELWEKRGGFDVGLKYAMDIDLWTRWAQAAVGSARCGGCGTRA